MKKFIREVFSDGGIGSFARVAQGVVVLSTVSWVSYVVWRNNAIPDLTGPTFFLSGGAASHYGLSKISGIVDAFKGKKKDAPEPEEPKTDEQAAG